MKKLVKQLYLLLRTVAKILIMVSGQELFPVAFRAPLACYHF